MARKENNNRRRLGRGLGSLIQVPVKVDLPDHHSDDHATRIQPGIQDAAKALAITTEPQIREAAAGSSTSTEPWTASDIGGDAGSSEPQIFEDGSSDDRPLAVALPMTAVHPNPNQPRRSFDEQSLATLADSIRSAGLMQPIVVRPAKMSESSGAEDSAAGLSKGGYQIIAGERRWRAALKVGLESIPAIIHDVDDRKVAQWSLVENLQREDLNPIEKAHAFQRLSDEFSLTHQQIAEAVGLNRVSVSNHIRLLELDATTLEMVEQSMLDLGHARALLGISSAAKRQDVAAKAVREGWSVRAIEQEVRRLTQPGSAGKSGSVSVGAAADQPASMRLPTGREAHLRDLEKQLGEHLGTRVSIKPGRKKGAGALVVEFYDNKQFEGVLERMQFSSY